MEQRFLSSLGDARLRWSFFPYVIVALIVVVSGCFMFYASSRDSAIMDELAHIPAGYGYVHQLDYRLNPEHPPLIKALSALPLLFADVSFPTMTRAWENDINGQWDQGRAFLYQANDHRADTILFLARIAPLLLTLLLIVVVYWFALKLIGPWWALLPTFFVGLSPNILAHGHYVTTDIGAALGFLATLFALNTLWARPNKKTIIIAGIIFGLAQLTKFSLVLMIPFALLLAFVHWLSCAHEYGWDKRIWRSLWQHVWTLALVFVIAYAIVWIVYVPLTWNYPMQRQISDTTLTLQSFGDATQSGSIASACIHHPSMRCLAEINIALTHMPVVRGFAQYMLGVLMVMQRSAGGNTAYFLGNVGGGGWWYYFPVVFLLKETLPGLLLLIIGLFSACKRIFKKTTTGIGERLWNYLSFNFAEFSMIVVALLYWAYSMKSPLNIGFRHILPTLPLLFILASISVKKWVFESMDTSLLQSGAIIARIKSVFAMGTKVAFKFALIIALVLWALAETAYAAPYFLSYFNQIGGGIWNGHYFVTDSNYDWGQDLGALADYVKKNNIQKIAVDYFGGGEPSYYLGSAVAIPWNSSQGDPLKKDIEWLAVSVNSLQSAKGHPLFNRSPLDDYSWLSNWQHPYAKAGTSIFIYRLR